MTMGERGPMNRTTGSPSSERPAMPPGAQPAPAPHAPYASQASQAPPVRTALALAIIAALLLLGELAGLIGRVVPWAGALDRAVDGDLENAGGLAIVLALVVLALVLVGLALGIASLVLSILVTVRGRGLLRRGGVILLVPIALSMFFGVSGDVDALPAWAGTALTAVGLLGDLLEFALMAVGLGFLVAGLRQLRRPTPAPAV